MSRTLNLGRVVGSKIRTATVTPDKTKDPDAFKGWLDGDIFINTRELRPYYVYENNELKYLGNLSVAIDLGDIDTDPAESINPVLNDIAKPGIYHFKYNNLEYIMLAIAEKHYEDLTVQYIFYGDHPFNPDGRKSLKCISRTHIYSTAEVQVNTHIICTKQDIEDLLIAIKYQHYVQISHEFYEGVTRIGNNLITFDWIGPYIDYSRTDAGTTNVVNSLRSVLPSTPIRASGYVTSNNNNWCGLVYSIRYDSSVDRLLINFVNLLDTTHYTTSIQLANIRYNEMEYSSKPLLDIKEV